MDKTPKEIALERIHQAAESSAEGLNLAGLGLNALPSEIVQLTNLTQLNLFNNQLTSLPPELGQLTSLTKLNLSGNQLTSLPPEIVQLTSLTQLLLNSNQLTSLPPEIVQLTNLTQLALGSNQLTSLPPEIVQLTSLAQLVLFSNQLTNLPPEIVHLISLTELVLFNNQLTNLPPEIAQLISLTQLDLFNNQLTRLPSEIVQLTSLTQLDLSFNQLTSLPPEIVQLTSLTQLDVSGNQLTSLPPEIVQLTSITKLSLNNNQLTSLPPEIVQLTSLTQLDLSSNQLTSLPPEIVQLTSLTQLDLSSNQLASLPPEIVQLTSLTQLGLRSNQLTRLPSEIVQFTSLTQLDLRGNQLTILPPEIGQLTNLTQLFLGSNQLTSTPPEIVRITSLTQLDLAGNQLTSLSPEIAQLTSLTQLFLGSNQLTSLPKEIAELCNLKNINLSDNPLELAIPAKWVGSRYSGSDYAQEILAYYKQMHAEGGRPLGEARVLVVGEADAGKTKLLRALLHGEHGKNFIDLRDPTDGIAVNSSVAEGVTLRFWDFGGQEIMHATHRFFLSRRCVYILVADSTRDRDYNEEKIEYWLELIKFYGADSPVLLVASKTESFSLNVNERGLQEKYPNLVKTPALQTSAKTGRGISELNSAILEQVKKLASVTVSMPKSFLAVKDALEELKSVQKVKAIEEAVYIHLCEENGIIEEERQKTLLQLMHDMGVVLHYEDDRLSDFGILNPEWATGGVYKIVNTPRIKESRGRFTLSDVKEYLKDENMYPAAMRRRIVDLMKKFELTYELPLQSDTYILPSALDTNQPVLSGWDVPTMTFEYRYPILQVGILHRFIVIAHELIVDNKQIWYSGVVLARGENQALIKADFRDKKITLRIKGAEETRRDFLYFIRMEFERIHGEGAKPQEYIYHPQYPNLALDFEEMKTLAKTEKEHKTVHNKEKVTINLRELLDGFVTPDERRKDEEKEQKESGRFEVEHTEKERIGDIHVTINGNMQGNLTVGDSNTSQTTMQDSFNSFPADIQSTLAELMKVTEDLLQQVEESEHTQEMKEELEDLKSAQKKSKPNKEKIKITVEGLKQAAQNLNDIGKPVLELATKAILLLNALPS